MAVILASQSPRRKELLSWLIPEFTIQPADVDEEIKAEHTPKEYVQEMARQKAAVIAENHPEDLIIASDTVVVLEDKILGKPKNRQQAYEMLEAMNGGSHVVYTSVVLRQGNQVEEALTSAVVTFYALTEDEIENYLDTGDYKDKAGAYGIQHQAGVFVEKIEGDYYSIVGFPVGKVNQMLKSFSF
ncbi:Maf family protein [Enterococcus pallens]|uniref:dTTP/UTP pyrophosphatase n=1 Tax=Enterococcus pallens ATCC BAA-351 TaxID=1158607 RepID=R2Q450_9ENTE|nr:Maf family protein [Enterococcus pallens]EOH91317.1 septum formation protein Maf [Enterococcus pallens ATCC BAA-351]EOU15935.1 septum formation protein Maf [Enterococcus pallens ATCC BAA-351]OJG78342.1 septum formation protein Maf [Enterococcus pallens]